MDAAVLADRIDGLEERVEELEDRLWDGIDQIEPGDQVEVVIQDPNKNTPKDAWAQIGGVGTFVRTPDDVQLDFAESVIVTVADVQEDCIVTVYDGR